MSEWRVIVGDCIASMQTLDAGSINTCVTSPPYFGLRDYGQDGQIGLEATPEAYVARLVEVFREVRRVLRDDGTLFLNLGDSYFGGGVRRAAPCGISGKEPGGFQASGCLCGSLCDACLPGYRFGISRSGVPPSPMPAPSIGASIREHMGSQSGHLPTLGLVHPGDRSEAANQGLLPTVRHAGEPLHGAQASMKPESSQIHPAGSRLSGQPSECLSCGCSLRGSAPVSARMEGCNCGTMGRGSGFDTSGKGAVSSASGYLTTESLKQKDLIGIPWRVAFALQADGWYLRQDIIWHKPNPMPESVTDRCTKAHEYIFLLSRSARYFYDADAIAERALGGRKFNGSPSYAAGDRNDAGSQSNEIAVDRNRRSVWTVAPKPFGGAHFATFPPDLIEPCILAGCPRGGTVLDPFGGSGTTAGVAIKHGRNAVLCELNPTYAAMMPERVISVAGATPDMFREAAE